MRIRGRIEECWLGEEPEVRARFIVQYVVDVNWELIERTNPNQVVSRSQGGRNLGSPLQGFENCPKPPCAFVDGTRKETYIKMDFQWLRTHSLDLIWLTHHPRRSWTKRPRYHQHLQMCFLLWPCTIDVGQIPYLGTRDIFQNGILTTITGPSAWVHCAHLATTLPPAKVKLVMRTKSTQNRSIPLTVATWAAGPVPGVLPIGISALRKYQNPNIRLTPNNGSSGRQNWIIGAPLPLDSWLSGGTVIWREPIMGLDPESQIGKWVGINYPGYVTPSKM